MWCAAGSATLPITWADRSTCTDPHSVSSSWAGGLGSGKKTVQLIPMATVLPSVQPKKPLPIFASLAFACLLVAASVPASAAEAAGTPANARTLLPDAVIAAFHQELSGEI